MLNLFHRFLPAYYLLLCAVLGLSLAWLVSNETGIRLASQATVSMDQTTRFSGKAGNRQPEDNRIILQRNIFDSTRPAQAATVSTASTAQMNASAQRNLVTSGPMTLVGTVVAEDESLAVINISGQIEVIRIHHLVPGSGTLVTVTRDFIEIEQNDGTLAVLQLETSTDAPSASSTAPHRATNTAGRGESFEIQALGENRWVLSANEAEKARDNIAGLIKQVRVEPYLVQGKTEGFIVKRIQRGTLLSQMGLKRGDILFAVNGTSLDSPEKGLQIFQQLREAKNLSVDLQRAGQPLNFQYEIK